jgi:fido (protein-threonine AMPylation protein)
MDTLSPPEDDGIEPIEPIDVMPDKLALKWCELLTTAVQTGLQHQQLTIQIAGQFQHVYPIYRWPDALRQALKIYENDEQYEHCSTIQELLHDVEIRLMTLSDAEQKVVEQAKRRHTKR